MRKIKTILAAIMLTCSVYSFASDMATYKGFNSFNKDSLAYLKCNFDENDFFVGKTVSFLPCTTYLEWVINAGFVAISTVIIILIVSLTFYKKEALMFLKNLKLKGKKRG